MGGEVFVVVTLAVRLPVGVAVDELAKLGVGVAVDDDVADGLKVTDVEGLALAFGDGEAVHEDVAGGNAMVGQGVAVGVLWWNGLRGS